MQAIKLLKLLERYLLMVALVGQAAQARETSDNSSTNQPVFLAELREESGIGQSVANRAYVTAGVERFSLLVPPGFRGRASDPSRMTLVTTNFDRVFCMRSAGPIPLDGQPLDPETCRRSIITAHPGAKILQEFSRTADGRSGPVFDAEWTESGGVGRRARIAFIPSRRSILEFSMLCSPDVFERGCQALNTIFATFRASDEKGELHISPLSDKL